jgi:ubiquinone/menaquinone biosynthesis C-methylase UbiE
VSISFDRAAGYYDQTRLLSQSVMDRIIPILAAELGRPGRYLEIGVGTGRFAVPLARTGVLMVGIDLSREMLRKLLAAAPAGTVPIAVADATRLPFATATFAGAVAAHVLHLIPDWTFAIAELQRVVKPGGRLLATRGEHREDGWRQEVRSHFFEEAGAAGRPPGLLQIEQLDDHMRALGASMRELPSVTDERTSTINERLFELEAGHISACWSLDDATRKLAAAATRKWALEHLGDLDEPRRVVDGTRWHAYDLPR